MTLYRNPIPSGTNTSEFTDVEKLQFMRDLIEHRRDKGIAIPRFVRSLSKAGYSISLADYKEAEQLPGKGIDHITAGMLEYAYRILNSTRVQNSVQGPNTARAMTRIAQARITKNLDYFDVAEELNTRNVPITEAEYRAAEQGMTKIVSYEVIIETAKILDLDPRRLIGS
jgi:hypothetical protein